MSKPAVMHQMQEIAHVYVNCFYASAERAFDPSLEGKPVIVLSNNDGCAVTRSPETKRLGIAMGDPWFKLNPPRGYPSSPGAADDRHPAVHVFGDDSMCWLLT